jgi:DNA-binding NarL/FixJ family response regulator
VRACLPAAELRECEHGAQAMALLAEDRADLVITDLQMPELGGEDFLLRGLAAGHLSSCGVIVISSAISPHVRRSLAAFPRICFLRKPATGDDISQAIRAMMAGA